MSFWSICIGCFSTCCVDTVLSGMKASQGEVRENNIELSMTFLMQHFYGLGETKMPFEPVFIKFHNNHSWESI